MEKIGITGAAGYIGSRVCHELKDTYEIIPLDNFHRGQVTEIDGISVISADIRSRSQLSPLQKADVILHLAAVSGVDECTSAPDLAYDVNVTGTRNVGMICAEESIPLIFPSTVAVFGNPVYFPMDEAHPRHPVNLYGKTKVEACRILRRWSETFPVYEFIKSNVFGIHVLDRVISRPNVISIFLESVNRGEPLTVYNPGTQARNFLHVEDAARSYTLGVKRILEESPVYKEYCIAGTDTLSVRTLAEMIAEKARTRGCNPEIRNVENPREETLVDRFDIEIKKAQEELGFFPRLTVEYEIEKAFSRGVGV